MSKDSKPTGSGQVRIDKHDDWQTMDEDSSRPHCSCGNSMDDSRLCVCLAESRERHRQALRSAFISYAVVVLGYRHAFDSLGGPEDPRFQEATWPASSGASPPKPAGDVCLRLSFGNAPCCGRNWSVEWLA